MSFKAQIKLSWSYLYLQVNECMIHTVHIAPPHPSSILTIHRSGKAMIHNVLYRDVPGPRVLLGPAYLYFYMRNSWKPTEKYGLMTLLATIQDSIAFYLSSSCEKYIRDDMMC